MAMEGVGLGRGASGGVIDNAGGAGDRGRIVSLEPDELVGDFFCSRLRRNAGKRVAGGATTTAAGEGGETSAGAASVFRKNAGKREPGVPLVAGALLVVTLLVALSRAEIWASEGKAGESG